MPRVAFDTLPDSSRVWVFGSEHPITDVAAEQLLERVDAFLDMWAAHGAPLHAARDWRERRFLTIAVDTTTENASGCSIDGLFRALRELEEDIGTTLLGGGRVYYRGPDGSVESATRDLFGTLGAGGMLGSGTRVFDTTVQTLGEWRERFERDLTGSWHARLIPTAAGEARPVRS